jgi:hypothetical protein
MDSINESVQYAKITDMGGGQYTVTYLPSRDGANAVITTTSTIDYTRCVTQEMEIRADNSRTYPARRNRHRLPADFPIANLLRKISHSLEFEPEPVVPVLPLSMVRLREAQRRQDLAVMQMRDARRHRSMAQHARRFSETRPRTRCRRSYGDVR